MAIKDIKKLRQKLLEPPTNDIDTEYDNPIDELRDTNPTFPIQQGISMNNPISTSKPREEQSIDDLYNPDYTDRDRYRRLLDETPERESPGFGRSLVAAALSLKAEDPIKTADAVQYAPYHRDMQSWKEKADPYSKAAQLENSANAIERQMATSKLNNDATLRRLDETERKNRETADTARQRIESNERIQAQKRLADEMKEKGYEFKVVGNKLYATAKDGSSYEAGEASDYSPLELAKLRHTNTMAEIGKRTEGAVQVRQTVPGGVTGGRTGNRTTKQIADDIEARRNSVLMRALDDEDLAEFVIPPTTANGLWRLKPPKGGRIWGGPDPEKMAKYKQLVRDAYGEETPPEAPTEAGLGPSGSTTPEEKESPIGPSKKARVGPFGLGGEVSTPGPTMADRAKRASYGPDFMGPIDVPAPTPPTYPANKTGNLGTAAERNAAGQKNLELRKKAIAFLQQHNMPIEEANIEHAIKVGDVK